VSQDFKIQQNVKVGNDLINLRADNPDEFKAIAEWTVANAALFVNVQAALAAVPPALAGNVSNVQVQSDAPPYQRQAPQDQGSWSQPQGQQPPSFAQPNNQGPACRHGGMEWKDFTSKAGNHIKGYFCPSPNRSDQCPPQYKK
jgi:hypothetical protein